MKVLVRTRPAPASRAALADVLCLVRPRVASMVALTALVGALLARGPARGVGPALEAVLWITLVTASASILNQVLERETDARMERTRHRPLVTGRFGVAPALLLAVVCGAAGTTALALRFHLLAALLALATLVAYVAVYTPLKRVSSLSTAVGALPGAAPPLLGYVALAGEVGPWGWSLFATLFAWQFPHFMAIAWLHRRDYARAGIRVLPALEGAEGMAGRQAFLYAVALIPVSLLPVFEGLGGPVLLWGTLALGLGYALCALGFALAETRRRARALLFASLAYLPLLLALILFDPMVRAAILR